jgi:Holliday junction DNA helicase RuvA
MVGYIRGKVIETFKTGKNVSSLVLWPSNSDENVDNGVGYTILVTDKQASAYVKGSSSAWWLYQVHTDSDNYYIGIESPAGLKMFLQLLEVSGVGPRSAMQLLDALSAEGIESAVQAQDVATLSKVPGIGKKSAAKIVLELAGKLVSIEKITTPSKVGHDEFKDVIATLVKLGYSNANAKDAVDAVRAQLQEMSGSDLSERVKFVLAGAS